MIATRYIIAVLYLASLFTWTEAKAGSGGFGLNLDEDGSFLASEPLDAEYPNMTFGFWVKDNYLMDVELMFFVKAGSENTGFGLNWYSRLLAVEFRDEAKTRFYNASVQVPSNGDWFHVAVSWTSNDRRLRLFQNAVEIASGTLPEAYDPFTQGGRFVWSKFLSPDWLTRGQVSLDEIFCITKALTPDEIAAVASGPLSPSLTGNVLFYWSFENISNYEPYWIYSDYFGKLDARVLFSSFGLGEGLANLPVRPILIASGAKYYGSGFLVVKQTEPNGLTVPALTGPNPGTPMIESLPTGGQLYLLQSNSQLASAALTPADLPAACMYGVRYVSNFAEGSANFTYSIGSDLAEVILLKNRPPSPAAKMTSYVDQATTTNIAIARVLYNPPSMKRRQRHYAEDQDADNLTCTLLTLPARGTLRLSSGDLIAQNQLPLDIADCNVVFTPPGSESGAAFATFNVSVSDGLANATSCWVVDVIDRFYPPAATNPTLITQENNPVTFSFPEASDNVVSFNVDGLGPVYDFPFLKVTGWPTLGKVYQFTPTGAGAEIIDDAPAVSDVTQWVAQALNASSRYADPSGWSEHELEGPPNAFPVYGDNPRAWAGAFANSPDWLVLKFNTPVFPSRIDIYMNWYSDLVTRVSAWDSKNEKWVIIWQHDDSIVPTFIGSSMVVSPPICPTSFPVDTILLEVAPGGPGAFPEIDAVSMTGSEAQPLPDLVDTRVNKMIYVPNPWKNGVDKIRYSINRCVNFARYRAANQENGVATVNIDSVNQSPTLNGTPILYDVSHMDTIEPLKFQLAVEDKDQTPLTAVVTRLPEQGSLRIVGGDLVRASSSFPADSQLVFTPPACTVVGYTTYNVTFAVTVTDGVLSASGDVTLTIDCIGNVRRASTGVDIFVFIVCGLTSLLCLVFMVLIIVWRDRKTIRKISPLFCVLTLAGALLVNISPIFLTKTLGACMAWFCFFTIGVTVFLGAIAAKTYRIDKIFNSSDMSIFAIPNWLLLAYVSVLTVVQIVLLIVFGVLFPMKMVMRDVPRETFVVHACHSGDGWAIVAGIEYAFLIAIFVFCAVFAWRVRRIPMTEYKESREIFLAVYNVGFVSLIGIPLANVLWYDPSATIAVISAATCFATTVSVIVLFITKFIRIATDNETSTGSGTSTYRSTEMSADKSKTHSKHRHSKHHSGTESGKSASRTSTTAQVGTSRAD